MTAFLQSWWNVFLEKPFCLNNITCVIGSWQGKVCLIPEWFGYLHTDNSREFCCAFIQVARATKARVALHPVFIRLLNSQIIWLMKCGLRIRRREGEGERGRAERYPNIIWLVWWWKAASYHLWKPFLASALVNNPLLWFLCATYFTLPLKCTGRKRKYQVQVLLKVVLRGVVQLWKMDYNFLHVVAPLQLIQRY